MVWGSRIGPQSPPQSEPLPLLPSPGYLPGISPPCSTPGLSSAPAPGGAWKQSTGPHPGGREEAGRVGAQGTLGCRPPPARPAAPGRTCRSSSSASPGGPAPGATRLRGAAPAAFAPAPGEDPGPGGGEARPGFPLSRARASGRGCGRAGPGCKEDPAGGRTRSGAPAAPTAAPPPRRLGGGGPGVRELVEGWASGARGGSSSGRPIPGRLSACHRGETEARGGGAETRTC